MKLKRYIPFLALAAGVLGAVLRGANLHTGYEAETCLPIPGNTPQTALVALSIAMVLLFFISSRLYKNQRGISFESAFSCDNTFYKMIAVLSGLAMSVAGVLGLYRLLTGQTSTVNALGESTPLISLAPLIPLWVLAIVTTASFIVLCKMQAGGAVTESRAIFSIIPMFWACFDLIITFKDNGASPFVSLYAFELFAAISLVFAFYFHAGFFYAKSSPARFMCTASLGVFFSFTCVGGYLVCALLGGSPVELTAEAVLRYICFAGASVYLLANLFIAGRKLAK